VGAGRGADVDYALLPATAVDLIAGEERRLYCRVSRALITASSWTLGCAVRTRHSTDSLIPHCISHTKHPYPNHSSKHPRRPFCQPRKAYVQEPPYASRSYTERHTRCHAATHAREVAPRINELLELPFKRNSATSDFHPRDHISFASQHPGEEPFNPGHNIYNPKAPNKDGQGDAEYQIINIWPDHCVEGTRGAGFIPEVSTILSV
jgi:hypothetical protein